MARLTPMILSAPMLVVAAIQEPRVLWAQSMGQGQEQARAGDVVVTKSTTTHAMVEDIDRANRVAALRTDDGRELSVIVPDSVRNFDQIEKGDHITISYHEATALTVRKPQEAPAEGSGSSNAPSTGAPATYQGSVQGAPLGQKPSGTATRVIDLTATVDDVDYDKRTITLRGPQGNVRTMDVGEDVENLDRIKKGDQVQVRHTEAVAAAVTK